MLESWDKRADLGGLKQSFQLGIEIGKNFAAWISKISL